MHLIMPDNRTIHATKWSLFPTRRVTILSCTYLRCTQRCKSERKSNGFLFWLLCLSSFLFLFFVLLFFLFFFLRLRFHETTKYPTLINSSFPAFLSLLIRIKEDLRKNLFGVFDGHPFYNFKIEFIRGALLRCYVARSSSGS